jgi:hypothetical protein
MPHLALVTTDGDALGAVELDHADPPAGTAIEHQDVILRVVGQVERETDDPEQLRVLVVEPV